MSKRKEKILGELGFTYAGLSGKTQKDFGRGKPFIPFMNIMANGKIDPKFMGLVEVAPNERQNAVQKGDLFFTTSSETPEEVGMTSVLLEDIGECYLNSFCFGFRLYNFDDLIPEFAPYLFRGNEVRKQIINLGQGYTRFNLPKTELLKKLKLELPSENEQKKISEILTKAVSIIEKTQAAIAKYKAIKQGMLQDLFTRGIDVNTNKLRPRYQDAPELYKESKLGRIPREWEDKELGDVGEVRMCRRVFNYETSDQGDIPFYKIRTFGKQPDAYISKELYDSYRQQFSFPNKGDILISAAGTIGRTIIYDGTPSYFQDSNIVWIENNGHLITNEYLYQVFQIVEYKTEGGTIQRLYNSILKSALFPCPPKPEQQLITERLNAIDNKLQTEQTYLQKMQSLKKGLMEDLLSGRKQVKINEATTV